MKRFILIAVVAMLVAGCATQESAPPPAPTKPVVSRQASWSGFEQNSGMIKQPELGEKGFAVNQDWVDGYDSLLARFGNILNPPRKSGDRDGIAKEGEHYRITDQVLMRHDVMNSARRASLKPPAP